MCVSPAAADAAPSQQVLLPGSRAPTAAPPLAGQATILETRFLRPIPSTERVLVGIDRSGRVVSAEVVQRLVVVRSGDYTFAVPGPVTDVTRAPGSQSDPGLRHDAVLWAGFSPGKRVLAARIELDPARAGALLPLRVTIERIGDRVRLRIRNTTTIRVPAFSADADVATVARALDDTRSAASGDGPLRDAFVNARGRVRTTLVTATAPLRITGRFGSKPIATVLGDGRPLVLELSAPAVPAPALRLSAEPVPPLRGLTPPEGSTWRRSGLSGRALIARAIATRLAFARTRQYDEFLAVPDPAATARAVFEYRVVARAAPPRPATPSSDSDGNVAVTLAVVLAAAAALAAAVVWWANS